MTLGGFHFDIFYLNSIITQIKCRKLFDMNPSERIITIQLALALLQIKIEFAFYKQKSGAGEIASEGHPDFISLKNKYESLTSQLKEAAKQVDSAEKYHSLLQQVLDAESD